MSMWILNHRTVKFLVFAILFVLATGLSWLIPPIQSPDEAAHLPRAYLISQGRLWFDKPSEELRELSKTYGHIPGFNDYIERTLKDPGVIEGKVDTGLLALIERHIPLPGAPSRSGSTTDQLAGTPLLWSGIEQSFVLPGMAYYFPLVYLPQATGLATGKALGLNIQHSYQLARTITLLACLGLLTVAFSLMAPSPVVIALLLLPMSLFQMLSPTIDGLTNALAVLAVSLFFTLLNRRHANQASLSLALIGIVTVLAMSRNHLVPLLALPFYAAWARRSKQEFALSGVGVVIAVAWTLLALLSVNDQRVVRNQTTTELVLQYLQDPLSFLAIVLASLQNSDLFTLYQRSFIGILGALDGPLPAVFYPLLWIGLALCALASVSLPDLKRDHAARLVLFGTAMASTGVVFFALLVTWTPHPTDVIQGVQGRYFMVPALLIAFALSGNQNEQARWRHHLGTAAVLGFAGLSLTALILTLLSRYP